MFDKPDSTDYFSIPLSHIDSNTPFGDLCMSSMDHFIESQSPFLVGVLVQMIHSIHSFVFALTSEIGFSLVPVESEFDVSC